MNLDQGELFERELESASIAAAAKHVAEGDGSALVVEGPAGIGKTVLLRQARAVARAAGVRVLSARGSELERQFAFGVVRQLFEPMLAAADRATREILFAGSAEQASGVFDRFDSSSNPLGDFAVLHGLYWLTANACENTPLMLLVDDLQWCDAPSLRFLTYLLPRLEGLGVLVVAGFRTGEPDVEEQKLRQFTTDPATAVLRPHALSAAAAKLVLDHALTSTVDPVFASACHRASGGNPFLLRELARTITAEGVAPNSDNAAQIGDLGAQAVAPLVSLRMARLPAGTADLAKAVAVLGDRADVATVAALAGQDVPDALTGVGELERMEILRTDRGATQLQLTFVHPLVQAAVDGLMTAVERSNYHRAAVWLLASTEVGPELLAAHILQVPGGGDPVVTDMLRAAATEAVHRGSPNSAYSYLRRCLDEPPSADQLFEVLSEAGRAAMLIDSLAAAELFGKAHALHTADPVTNILHRAGIAVQYASALLYCGRIEECKQILTDNIANLPAEEHDLRRQLQAWLAIIVLNLAGHENTRQYVAGLRDIPPNDSVGGRMLDCALALQEALSCEPQAIARARRGLSGGPMFEIGGNFTNSAWFALLLAGAEDLLDIINEHSGEIHRRGDVAALGGAHLLRGHEWLNRGQLAEASVDLQESLRVLEMAGLDLAIGVVVPPAVECLAEQGRFEQAATILDRFESAQITPYLLSVRAQLLYLRGAHGQALQAALDSRDQGADIGLTNPSATAWRTWAALALHSLNRDGEAREIAADELRLAQKWGAPRSLGVLPMEVGDGVHREVIL